MRHPSLRSKRIRLPLVVALAACSSLVLAASASAASLNLSAPANQPVGNAYVDVSGTVEEPAYIQVYAQPDNGGSCPSTRTQTPGSHRWAEVVEPGPFSFTPHISREDGQQPGVMNPGAYLLCGYIEATGVTLANDETRTTLNAPACSWCAPPGHVFGNPVVTLTSASYRQLPNSKGWYGDGRLSVHGVINPQGRPGVWSFEYSSKPDFNSAFGGACGTHEHDFHGEIKTYDSNDHPVSASPAGSPSHPSMKPECWISPQSQPSPLYVRLTYNTDSVAYSDGQTYPATNGCGGPGQQVPGPARPSCKSNTLVVHFEFKRPTSKKRLITALRGSLAQAAKIGAILKKGFSPARFKAPSAGSAGITWTLPASGARAAKKVVVAKGSKKVSRAGKTTIKVKLTKRGKALLKQAKRAGKSLKLKATGTFKPRGGSKVGTSRTIKLKN